MNQHARKGNRSISLGDYKPKDHPSAPRDAYLFGTADVNAIGDEFGNIIAGNSGGNKINGSGGDDILTGGLGDDAFVFEKGSGNDIVTDFSSAVGNNDHIDVSAYSFRSFNELMSKATANGSDTVIQLRATDSITLVGVQLSSLESTDFII